MASIGYKKKGDSGPLYNPERDYAYITPTLMRIAIENLDAESGLIADLKKQHNITQDEVVKIAEALAEAQKDFVNAADPVSSFSQALRRHGFQNFRPAVQQLLFASVGEVFCAAWFTAVREVSLVGEESPAAEDMARFTAVVREFASNNKRSWYDANHMAEHLSMLNDVLQARVNELGRQVVALQQELAKKAQQQPTRSPCQKPQTLVEMWRDEIERRFGLKGNKCPSTGCTKTRPSSRQN